MKIEEFKNFIKQQELDFLDPNLIKQSSNDKNDLSNQLANQPKTQTKDSDSTKSLQDCDVNKLTLDKIVKITQQLPNNQIKTFQFIIVQVWLRPSNMFTIVNVNKKKLQKNFWTLFYSDGCYYLKKGLKGPICVHCQLKSDSEQE